MKRIIVLLGCFLFLFGAQVFARGGGEAEGELPEVVLRHNKVEIGEFLSAYAEEWGEQNGVIMTIDTQGGGADVGISLQAAYQAGDFPDIFVADGLAGFREWEGVLTDLSDEPWVENTSVPYVLDGRVVGFPVSIEGWGLAYNAEILDRAGVDPSTLNNLSGYREAFAKIDAMKDELGLDAVVSMAASLEMTWVTAFHNINSYLSNGLEYGDTSITDMMIAGELDTQRFAEYADWVELIFQYADQAILATGNYDAQVAAFVNQNTAFLHQGNWIDPNLAAANATFEMAFAPHGSREAVTDGIFVSAPSWYVVSNISENIELAKKFLRDMVATERGHRYMVTEAGMIPAYNNVTLRPSGPLSKSVQEWSDQGKIYSWNQYFLSAQLRDEGLAPIYNQLALGDINKQQFIDLFTDAVARFAAQ